ncbi:glycosyltransferase [Paeniglutamicibacter sp. NPDC012692]|uniref:glycosyltransferase n=1 Tax=Paeniglutamicibacter sp. NPDC012692 TaxID=3364388 RepID=UPI0036A9860E
MVNDETEKLEGHPSGRKLDQPTHSLRADTADAQVSLHNRELGSEFSESRESVQRLLAETTSLRNRRNELLVQIATLERERDEQSIGRRDEHSLRVGLEKRLAAERARTIKYKTAYERLKSHPVIRLARAVTTPVNKLSDAGLRKNLPQALSRKIAQLGGATSSPLQIPTRNQRLLNEIRTAYRVGGNASRAQDLASKLPEKFAPAQSDRILLDQIDGVLRLLAAVPTIPTPQSGAGYVAQPGRIMYCAHSTGGFNSNGYSTRTAGLTEAMAGLGCDIFVAARPGYPWDAKTNAEPKSNSRFENEINGVRTVYNPGTSWSGRALDQYIHEAADIYAREAMINRPSWIVAASNHVTALPALIAARRLGIPFAYEVRGLWEITEASAKEGYADSERFALASKLETAVANNADHVFAITSQVKDELVQRGTDPAKITLLPNAADVYEFAPLPPDMALSAKYSIESGITLGYAGSVLAYEGLDLALHALAELMRGGVAANLVIVGDGPALADLKTLANKLGVTESVQFVGRVPAKDVPRYVELFDIVLCPRISSVVTEMVSPLKPLEAMAAGRPVIASNVAPLVDLLGTDGSRGALFNAGDAADLARTIRELADNKPKRKEIGRTARRWIVENRSWSEIARRQIDDLLRFSKNPDNPSGKPLSEVTVALISDEFTRSSMQGDVNLVLPTPANWKALLEETRIDLLFVESAWEGNGGSWTRKVGYYDDEECRELRALVSHCRSAGIPTVFWNKEDPVHFNRFRKTAKFFDHVFTTDANCLKEYWAHRGSHLKTLASLPFWAQPGIHNPLPSGDEKQHTVAYGGTYYGDRFEKRSKELVTLLDTAVPQGLTIYDRQFNNPDSPYLFPEHLQRYVQGGLPYTGMLKAYKNHPVHINVNSVSNSPTMFSRRVFELAACGTPVLSGPGLEIGGLFGTAIPSSLTEESTEELVSRWMTDERTRIDAAWTAFRTVYRSHLSIHRLAYVMRVAGLSVTIPKLPDYILQLEQLNEQLAIQVLGQSHLPSAVVAVKGSTPEATALMARHGIEVLESTPAEPSRFIGSLGDSLKDPFAAEDLATALHYTGAQTATVVVGEPDGKTQSLWQLGWPTHSSATMAKGSGKNGSCVSIRRMPNEVQIENGPNESIDMDVLEPLTILVAGHDLKFATGIMKELEAAGHTVVVDHWTGHAQHDPNESLVLLEDADVIFCEWSLGNLAWYSRHKRPGQRLISRFHLQELFTTYPAQTDFDKVDQIVFVGEFIRRVAIRKFGIPESLTSVISNAVDLEALDLPKTADARFNIGLVGIVPERKGLDVALDLLATLRATDDRYKLFIKGRRPEDYPWMAARPAEMAFYAEQYERIQNDPLLRGAVTFDGHGNDMAEWYRKIGVALSVSDFESFHYTLADGAASGAVPVSLAWAGAEFIYPESWLSSSVAGLAKRILQTTGQENEFANEGADAVKFARHEFSYAKTLGSLMEILISADPK